MSDDEDDEIGNGNIQYDGINKELIIASKYGKNDLVRNLISKGANVYCIDGHGWNALHWACANGHVDTLRDICDNIKDNKMKSYINAREKLAGWTALHVCK